MLTAESKPQAERTVPGGLKRLTEREANETVGGCGGREYSPSTSDVGPYRPVAIVADRGDLT